MVPRRIGRSLRDRIFLSFLLALVPVFVLLAASVELFLVPYMESRTWDELTNSTRVLAKSVRASASIAIRNHLKAIAEKNKEIARYHLSLVDQDVLSHEEAISRLRRILLSQQVGSSGYIYCINSEGIAVVHPNPRVEGTDNTRFAFVRRQMERKEGYLEYDWQNPGEESPRPKALYMVYCELLDWIISVSSYRSEFNELLNPNDFRETVLSLRFGKSGYSYVLDKDGTTLIHPVLKDFNAFSNPDIPSDFVRQMLATKSGSLEYEWKNPEDHTPRRKIAVYEWLPEFGWVIVSSAYRDDIMRPVQIARSVAYGAVILLLMGVGASAYLLSGRLTRPMNAMIHRLDQNARLKEHEPLPVDTGSELGRLAREFNAFIATIHERNMDLARERARYRSLFESSPDAVFLLSGVTIVDCNPATLSIFCGNAETIIGSSILDLSPKTQPGGESSAAMSDRLLKASMVSDLQTFEWLHQTVDGRLFEAEVRLKPFGKDGDKPLMVAFVRDITERNRAERALRQERDFNRALIDATPACIVILNLEGRIRQMNPAFRKILGYEVEEIRQADFFELATPEEDRPNMKARLEKLKEAISREEPVVRAGSLKVITRRGEERTIQYTVTWLAEHRGEEKSIMMVGVDITDERALQEQLHHAQKLDAIGRLAGGIAHDFNNMLGGILGAAELLEMNVPPTSQMYSHVRLIMDTVERAAELSGRLLAFSRKGKSVSTPLELHKLLHDALRIFGSGLDPRIQISTDLKADNPMLIGDPSQLQSVFLNLFINARDAMPDGGQLRVATRDVVLDQSDCDASPFYLEPGTYIEALVSDTGTGMDEKTLAKIFEPFFTTKGEGQGTGLGLATAYAAIKNHNGEIHAESQPGTGTSFIIHLPESAAEALPPSEYAMLEHGTGTILLVDDDEVLRTTGRMMLEELGYNVLLARDGSEALAQFEMHHKLIDLTILDMIMPQMSGRDVFRAIRSISPRAKVVLASGFSDRQAVQDLEQEGLYGFLQKPYRIAQLSGIISEAIQKTKGEI